MKLDLVDRSEGQQVKRLLEGFGLYWEDITPSHFATLSGYPGWYSACRAR